MNRLYSSIARTYSSRCFAPHSQAASCSLYNARALRPPLICTSKRLFVRTVQTSRPLQHRDPRSSQPGQTPRQLSQQFQESYNQQEKSDFCTLGPLVSNIYDLLALSRNLRYEYDSGLPISLINPSSPPEIQALCEQIRTDVLNTINAIDNVVNYYVSPSDIECEIQHLQSSIEFLERGMNTIRRMTRFLGQTTLSDKNWNVLAHLLKGVKSRIKGLESGKETAAVADETLKDIVAINRDPEGTVQRIQRLRLELAKEKSKSKNCESNHSTSDTFHPHPFIPALELQLQSEEALSSSLQKQLAVSEHRCEAILIANRELRSQIVSTTSEKLAMTTYPVLVYTIFKKLSSGVLSKVIGGVVTTGAIVTVSSMVFGAVVITLVMGIWICVAFYSALKWWLTEGWVSVERADEQCEDFSEGGMEDGIGLECGSQEPTDSVMIARDAVIGVLVSLWCLYPLLVSWIRG